MMIRNRSTVRRMYIFDIFMQEKKSPNKLSEKWTNIDTLLYKIDLPNKKEALNSSGSKQFQSTVVR